MEIKNNLRNFDSARDNEKRKTKHNIMSKEVKKVAIIKLHDDYGGIKAWTIRESFDGVVPRGYEYQLLKREYFGELQNVIMDYLSEGYEVEISK